MTRGTPTSARPLLLGLGWDRPGGLNRYLRGLRDALADVGPGSRTVVLAPASSVPASVIVVAHEDAPLVHRLVAYARAARSARSEIDVVDVHFGLFAWWPVRWGSLRRHPLVVHFHGPWSDESASSRSHQPAVLRIKHGLERSLYRRADGLVVLSAAFKRLLVEDYGVAPWLVRVIPPGLDLERFSPDRSGARARLGLDDDTPVVFAARRLVPRMGLPTLLEAWVQLQADGRPRRLLIAGQGPQAEELQERIDELGLGDSVQLLGVLSEDDLVDHYRAADLCVLPSLTLEGFGLSVVEALACGTPVVVTEVGGLPEAIRGLDPTLAVPPGQATALADRIRSALGGNVPDAARCRAHAESFSWSAAAAANQDLYDTVLTQADGQDEHRRLKVVYLDHCADLSGAEIALARLLPGLKGVDAHVVLGQDGPLVDALRNSGVSVTVRPLAETARSLGREQVRPRGLPLRVAVDAARYVAALAVHLHQLQPDLVHTNSLKSGLYGGLAGRLARVPVVWHARDRIAADYLPAPAVRLVQAAVQHLPSAVIANSSATLDTLSLSGRQAAEAVVIGDPYRRRTPHKPPAERPEVLAIGMVGRLAEWKGQSVLLEALRHLGATPAWRAVLVGSAMFGEHDYEARLRQEVQLWGLGDQVDLVGFRPDVEAELLGLDILVHASVIPEPFGQVVVEGMAAGLPVVASAAGGPLELIRDGVDGLLFPSGDSHALAEALTRLIGDPALRERLGRAARHRAADYAPEVIAPEFERTYRRVLGWG